MSRDEHKEEDDQIGLVIEVLAKGTANKRSGRQDTGRDMALGWRQEGDPQKDD